MIISYKQRCERAAESQRAAATASTCTSPKILSMIIDGMDQNHCHVPYLGTQQQFSSPLKQHIVGVKEHGPDGYSGLSAPLAKVQI